MFQLFLCSILFGAFEINFAFPSVENNSSLLHDGNLKGKTYCCDYRRTCGQTTYSKLSYFVNPSTSRQDCPLTVKIYSRDVCQIRLDFEEFEIYQPTNIQYPQYPYEEINGMAYKCYVDKFRVEKAGQDLGFSSLCGKNEGQHIYIPVQKGQSEIVLRFLLRNRTPEMPIQFPRWRIKIHQLQCSDQSNSNLIAPPNCLQYYHDLRSTFESFNYNDGQGRYIGGLDYLICFRKTSDICSVTYSSANKFQMNYNVNFYDDRCHPNAKAGECISQDYIRINNGKLSNGQQKEYYCGQDFPTVGYVTSTSRELLYMKVHTDDYRAFEVNNCDENSEDHAEIGFRFIYNLGYCY